MDLIRWYLYCRLFVLVIGNSQQPEMSQMDLTNGVLRFECTVKDYSEKFKVHFNCNINNESKPKTRCMEDCKKVSESGVTFNCSKDTHNGKTVFRYVVHKNMLPSGYYSCAYKNSESSFISHTLESVTSKTIKSTSTFLPSTVPPKKSYVQIELVFVLLGILILSILVNVAFLIRCIIIRSYLDRYNEVSRRKKRRPGWSWVTCFCLKEELKATDTYYKTREDPYDKIRDHPSSEISKSKSSITNDYLKRPISQDTEKLCFSSNTSQISRSSTFPARQSIIVHTPTDQFSISALPGNTIDNFQPFMIHYAMDPNSKTMMPIMMNNTNRRMSSQCIYDDVPGEHIMMNPSSTMPIRHFASTGSLQNRSRQGTNTNLKTSPLPEETQLSFTKFNKEPIKPDEEIGLMMNDCSSVLQDYSGSEETYLSGKDSDSMKDPVRVAKLEMSREMMAKADTLLREAHNLLKMS